MLNFMKFKLFSNTKIVHQNISDALKIASKNIQSNLVDLGCGFKPYLTIFEVMLTHTLESISTKLQKSIMEKKLSQI